MKASIEWLKDYVEITQGPERLAEILTMAGLEVEGISGSGGDSHLEIEVTPNRADCLSMLGLAREISALTGKRLRLPQEFLPQFKLPLTASRTSLGKLTKFSINIENANDCFRYIGWQMLDLKVAASCANLMRRLKGMGLRPVNNVVDITNFSLFESGQPLHAFDYDKIRGGVIIVRRARKSERIVTIDGISRELTKDDLVIADEERPIALAGIMGGKDTEVTETTKNVLLESASFNPALIRQTSRRLALSTESSYRFEREVSLDGVFLSARRAVNLIRKAASPRLIVLPEDRCLRQPRARSVSFRIERTNQILGTEISSATIKKMFLSLGFEVRPSGENKIRVIVPSYRSDISREIDLIEEVARLFGYDRIPAVLPKEVSGTLRPRPRGDFEKKKKKLAGSFELKANQIIRETVLGLGLNEIITYSLIGARLLKRAGFAKTKFSAVTNPLSQEQELLRPSQVPGMLASVSYNLNQGAEEIRMFELGRVFLKAPVPGEEVFLTVALSGHRRRSWQGEGKKTLDFFDVKGIIEVLLARLGVRDIFFLSRDREVCQTESASAIMLGEKEVGFLGEISDAVRQGLEIERKVFIAEISISRILSQMNFEKRFRPFSRYPTVVRDVSLIVKEGVPSDDIVAVIKESAEGYLERVELFDLYRGGEIPPGKKSLAYSLEYRDRKGTLEGERVERIHSGVLAALAEKLGAEPRSGP